MAAAEARGNWQQAANRSFVQEDARRTKLSSCCPSSSSKFESDVSPGDAAKGSDNPVPGCTLDNPMYSKPELLPESKWWLHLRPNLGHLNDYSKEQLNALEAELGVCSAASINQKFYGEKQLKVEDHIQIYLKSNTDFIEQPLNAFPTCIENNQDLKAVIRGGLQKAPMNKVMREFYNANDYLDLDGKCLVDERSEKLCSELESHWIGNEKTDPWWRIADKDELASLVSNKKLEHFENCDLPRPQSKHFGSGPSDSPECFNQDKDLALIHQRVEKKVSNLVPHKQGTSRPITMRGIQCILGEHCSPGSSERILSTNDGFDLTTADVAEMLQSPDSDLTKAQLLEALCHSQTRAREAEKAAQQAYNEKEHIVKLFFKQASHLFAYRLWLQLLQIEASSLQLKNSRDQSYSTLAPASRKGSRPWKGRGNAAKRKVWPQKYKLSKCVVAFAVGLSLVGAGLLLGWTMGWLFPAL